MSVTVLDETRPVARKEHRCSMCRRTIRPGETYRRQRNIYEGDPYVWKECAHCLALVNLLRTELDPYNEGVSEDDLADYRPDTMCDARWLVQWRRKWTRRDGDLYEVPAAAGEPQR